MNDQDHIIKRIDDVLGELSEFTESAARGAFKITSWYLGARTLGFSHAKKTPKTTAYPLWDRAHRASIPGSCYHKPSQASGSGAMDGVYAADNADVESGFQSKELMKESLETEMVRATVFRLNLRTQSDAKHCLQKQNRAMKKAEEVMAASTSASQKRVKEQNNKSRGLYQCNDYETDLELPMARGLVRARAKDAIAFLGLGVQHQ
ncbi:hypothetical protein BGX24_005003 [Mortierella sp. AD032]|nr:hypothetical protein BGX24_005003 [Mortierella sp. AD032]